MLHDPELVAETKAWFARVHRQPLLDGWIAQLAMFLAIDAKEVGRIGGGARKPNGRLDVAMIQSLVRKERVDDIVATYGHVVVDESHHVPAASFERVLSEVKVRDVVDLTATPHRRDDHHPILALQLGPVRFSVAPRHRVACRKSSAIPSKRPRSVCAASWRASIVRPPSSRRSIRTRRRARVPRLDAPRWVPPIPEARSSSRRPRPPTARDRRSPDRHGLPPPAPLPPQPRHGPAPLKPRPGARAA